MITMICPHNLFLIIPALKNFCFLSLDQFTDLSLAYNMWQGPQQGTLFNSSERLTI